MSAATIDRVARRASPGDAAAPFHQVWDPIARHDLCNSVRRALPGCSAVEGLRAVRTLAAIVSDPLTLPDAQRERARRTYLDIPTDGTMNPFMAPPDGWEARKHAAPSKDGLIIRRGKARVIGASVCDLQAPCNYFPSHYGLALPEGIRTRLYDALEQLERTNYGASAYDVDRVTDLYFVGEIPRKVGTDAILAHEVGNQDDDGSSPDGELRGVTGHARHKPRHPTRVTLPQVVGRKSEGVSRCHLAAHADREGYVWIGHTLKPRGPLARTGKGKPRTVKVARTIDTVRADTPAQVAEHAARLKPEQRIIVLFHGHKLSVTMGKKGKRSLSAGKGKSKSGLRTLDALAIWADKLTTS